MGGGNRNCFTFLCINGSPFVSADNYNAGRDQVISLYSYFLELFVWMDRSINIKLAKSKHVEENRLVWEIIYSEIAFANGG